ncbi:RNA polymerase Rpb4 family protein [Methanocorpusculum sp.]|nr:RNA polymerase Rpb4 family protein [Methanocorpusculum sp.]MBP3444072.1 RNA polymerase Rpb4 family protein [Methanocorpusculaceae archaeon]MBO5368647.1 RNA polymerase Rpb4 family protein [Methanocorpusculum sp.]MBO5432298.1 RNA polymerase Rpb4 family protein [Methanocorpusculum sp.]MBQ3571088.1 RNA polymerase Rpb4 family protein [Methanocorpusculum sp.]
MKVKKIIQEEMMTLPELREELIAIRDQRAGGLEETEGAVRTLSYELRKSIDHADTLGKCSVETAKALYDELAGLEKITPTIASRIVNIMPASREEIRAIYAKERFALVTEDVDQILDILRKYE